MPDFQLIDAQPNYSKNLVNNYIIDFNHDQIQTDLSNFNQTENLKHHFPDHFLNHYMLIE